jgi:aryl-alcohol dehydrogenase-like predicted oxidoreductase
MKYRVLGSTGLKVSVIGIGTWQYGGEWGKAFTADDVREILSAGIDAGCNLIDTAECYGDHLSEALIGDVLADRGDREKLILATKFGHKFHGYMNRTEPRAPADITEQLNASLKALRTDYIDLYQYHSWGDSDFAHEGVRDVLERAKAAGKIRHIGNSIGPKDRMTQVEQSAAYGVEMIQVIYSRLEREAEKGVLPLCAEHNLGVLARVPLASGFLSGKYKPGATWPLGDVRAGRKAEETEARLKEVESIAKNEIPPGVPMAQWALAWCLRHPAVTSVIPGAKDRAQMASNAAAADLVEG